jgi:hypothetical protein
MNATEIIALQVGAPLDNAVHVRVFGLKGKAPPYSTDDATALQILDRVPLFVASIDPDKPDYSAERPFVAGRLQHENSVKGDITILRVTGATKAIALCRAALIALAKLGPGRTEEKQTIGQMIGEQVAARRDEEAERRKSRQPIPLRRAVPQPGAGVTKNLPRQPMPKRKPFMAQKAQEAVAAGKQKRD